MLDLPQNTTDQTEWSNAKRNSLSHGCCIASAPMHLGSVSRLYIEEVNDRELVQKYLLLVSPYAKLFSENLEHGVFIGTCPVYFEIPSYFYVQAARKIFCQ